MATKLVTFHGNRDETADELWLPAWDITLYRDQAVEMDADEADQLKAEYGKKYGIVLKDVPADAPVEGEAEPGLEDSELAKRQKAIDKAAQADVDAADRAAAARPESIPGETTDTSPDRGTAATPSTVDIDADTDTGATRSTRAGNRRTT